MSNTKKSVKPNEDATAVLQALIAQGRKEGMIRADKLNAQLEKLPYMLVIGENEMNDKTVAVRSRREGDLGSMSVDAFLEAILAAVKEKRR